MAEQSLKDKTAKGLFWGGVSSAAQQILGLVFGIILARVLTPNDYGIVGMLTVFTMIASIIQDSGFSVALINKKDFIPEDFNAVFWFNIVMGTIMYLVLYMLAPFIADFYKLPELCVLSRFLFLGFLFGSFGVAQNAVLTKMLMVQEKTKVDICSLSISGCIGIIMALSGFGYWGLATQSVVYVLVGTLLKWYFSPWRPTLNWNILVLKGMFGFSFKLLFTNIIFQISNNIFSVLLGRLYNATQVGYYSQGNKWMMMGHSFVGNVMNSVAHPVLAQAKDDVEYQKKIFRKMTRFGAFLSFPLLLGLAFTAKEFIWITVGEKWLLSVPFLQLFCIWGCFAYLWNLYINLLYTQNRSDIYMYVIIAISILQLIVVGFMFSYGIYVMLSAYLLTYFAGLFVWHFYVKKMLPISYVEIFCDIVPYLAATVVSFIVSWILTMSVDGVYATFILKIFYSVIMYILILYFSGSVILRESVHFIWTKLDKSKK